jgi:hypothetical protein
MTAFRLRDFTNKLTDRLRDNPNTPLLECLMDVDLGPAVKNEAAGLIEYLKRKPDGSSETNLARMARYALTYESKNEAPQELLTTLRMDQPSRNAATVLSAPNRKLMSLMNGDARAATTCPIHIHQLWGRPPGSGHRGALPAHSGIVSASGVRMDSR